MSVNLANVYSTQFSNMVKPIYQQAAKFNNTIMTINGVQGSTYQFQRGGIVKANPKASSELITPSNVQYDKPVAILDNSVAAEFTDIFDQQMVAFREGPFLVKSIGNALGRATDQKVINAMAALTPGAGTLLAPASNRILGDGVVKNTALVDADIKPLSLSALIAANGILNRLGVPNENRYLALNAVGIDSLMANSASGINQVTSGDYNTTRVLVNGQLDTYLGFKIIMIGDRLEGGLPTITPTSVQGIYGFAFHSDAIGMAMGIAPRIEVTYQAQYTSWLTTGLLLCGSAVIDRNGIVQIVHKNAIV